MKRRKVKTTLLVQEVKRLLKYPFVATILAPTIVMFVYIRPVHFPDGEVLPLDAGMQYVQNVIKYPVVGEGWSLSP